MRYGCKRKFLCYGFVVCVALIILLHPDNNARGTYEFIRMEKVSNYLCEDLGHNFSSTALVDCDYYDIIRDDTTLPISLVDGDLIDGHGIKEGGEHAPMDCKPKYSTAIIVPYRFVLPYLSQLNGAISISSKQFKTVNGLSNNYDVNEDDLFARLESHNIKICRFDPKTSIYHRTIDHQNRKRGIRTEGAYSKDQLLSDGLSSLKYTEVATVLHPLFTHIMVDL